MHCVWPLAVLAASALATFLIDPKQMGLTYGASAWLIFHLDRVVGCLLDFLLFRLLIIININIQLRTEQLLTTCRRPWCPICWRQQPPIV